MKAFVKHTGIAASLMRSNVDTDQIIPKQFLKKIERSGFGKHLFHDWRFLDDEGTEENPDFILNNATYRNASILVAGENFGCGSSREHAPWALEDFGIRVIISPSYADIFYNNCFKNGMLPIILTKNETQELFDLIAGNPGIEFEIDLAAESVNVKDKSYSFNIDAFRKECLLNGWDDIGLTLRHEENIDQFEKKYYKKHPYMMVFEA